jgi:hypothetical protein
MNIAIARVRQPLSVHVVWMFILLIVLGSSRFLPHNQCLFHDITGYPCLSCGISRAADALFDGDILGMIYYNPLAVLFCAGLFFFSLFKLIEFIFNFRVFISANNKVALVVRIGVITSIIANWAFLIVTGR